MNYAGAAYVEDIDNMIGLRDDTIYVDFDGEYFYSPDGCGKIWFDNLNEIMRETGLTRMIYLYPRG